MRILCSGMPETREKTVRMACGACVVIQTVSLPLTASTEATQPQVSIEATWMRGMIHVLLDDDVGLLDRVLGRFGVPRLPMEDAVVLDLAVRPQDGCVLLERLEGIDDDRQRLVVDLDGRGAVGGGVAAVGDDRGHLLALVHHGVERAAPSAGPTSASASRPARRRRDPCR